MDIYESTDKTIKALKLQKDEYVLLQLPIDTDQGIADKLAFQVRRSWPGLNVLIMAGDVEVTVIARDHERV